MRVMLDTNILISALLFPSVKMDAFMQAVTESHHVVLCDYVIEELWCVVRRKFPSRAGDIDRFLGSFPFELIYTPKEWSVGSVPEIRDMKDAPILATAVLEGIDIFVTGDKDFLVLDVDLPRIMTMTEFIAEFGEAP